MTEKPETPALFEVMRQSAAMIMQGTPHARALGLSLTDLQKGKAWGTAAFRADLVGDPATGVIAGGVITAFLDNLCGVAVMSALEEPTSVATLDLRIDYMRAAKPGADVLAMAHCYRVTRSVAFVRAVAYDVDEADPVASAAGAFILAANAGRKPGANKKPPK